MARALRWLVAAAAVGAGVLAAAAPAGSGTFPGTNGLIAYTSGSNIDAITADGTVITTIVAGETPSWSADGTKIAYSRSGDLYIADANGSNEVQLTSGAATDQEPSWSPDGTQIAFMREETGPPTDRDVAVVDVATQAVTEVITGSFQASHPAWSPDGTEIAYRSNQSGCASSFCIYLANPDGSGQTELVDSTDFRASSQPSWSPDGATVVFVYDDNPDATIYDGGIAVVSAAGGTPTALTVDATLNESNPAFSPDGLYIAFVRNGVLWQMEADGDNAAIYPATVASIDLGVSWAVVTTPVSPEPPGPPGSSGPPVAPPVVVTPSFAG